MLVKPRHIPSAASAKALGARAAAINILPEIETVVLTPLPEPKPKPRRRKAATVPPEVLPLPLFSTATPAITAESGRAA
jgi:hypothetical protein